MYKKIRSHPTTLQLYSEKLIKEGVITEADLDGQRAEWREKMDADYEAGQNYKPNKADWLDGTWTGLKIADREDDARRGSTGYDLADLKRIGEAITKVPEDFKAHKTIMRFMKNRAKMIDTGKGIDWATGEALAFGCFCDQGHPIRLSGPVSYTHLTLPTKRIV